MGRRVDAGSRVRFINFRRSIHPCLVKYRTFIFPSCHRNFPGIIVRTKTLRLPRVIASVGNYGRVVIRGGGKVVIPPRSRRTLCGTVGCFLSGPGRMGEVTGGTETVVASHCRHGGF